jgi:hypothetical protein
MKHLAVILSLCVLAACTKNDTETRTEQKNETETCDFGITNFNLTKRAPLNEIIELKKPQSPGGGSGGSGGTGGTGGGTVANPGVILIDFDGQVVSGTSWYGGGTINCAPANLSSAAINTIIDRMRNDYAPFNITVTGDEAVYNAASTTRRMRVILTETWEWFGQAGGTAFLNSFTWGNNTPCFVFTSLLNYSEKNIGEAASHEAGHTLGLRHQSVYSGTTLIAQYNYGQGTGETGWAPIMGCSYNQNLSTWHNGPNDLGYTSYQNEVPVITAVVGAKPDDYSNTTTGAATLTGTAFGNMNSSSDADFFLVNLATSSTVSAVPFSVAPGNNGANLDLVLKVYNSLGQLVATMDNPYALNVSGTLAPGQYYISVSTTPNAYASTYGMLGQYSIGLN